LKGTYTLVGGRKGGTVGDSKEDKGREADEGCGSWVAGKNHRHKPKAEEKKGIGGR